MPISKELFDSAMKSIVKYYPDLYQQFINGWSYAQIEQNMDGFINYYKTRFESLMNLLKIPVRSMKNPFYQDQITYHTQEALIYFIRKMLDPYCELAHAIVEYTNNKRKELEAQRERERIEREEREAMRAEQEAYGGRSSGSSILKTAVGVALGNKISSGGKKKSANGKIDLWGTAACPYGQPMRKFRKDSPSFMTVSCNMSCPRWGQCSRA